MQGWRVGGGRRFEEAPGWSIYGNPCLLCRARGSGLGLGTSVEGPSCHGGPRDTRCRGGVGRFGGRMGTCRWCSFQAWRCSDQGSRRTCPLVTPSTGRCSFVIAAKPQRRAGPDPVANTHTHTHPHPHIHTHAAAAPNAAHRTSAVSRSNASSPPASTSVCRRPCV